MAYWLQFTLFAIMSGLIQYLISYYTEKGKNLATKEDVKEITDKVEQVKENYNKSLETHKLDLQKDFESYKYINQLCHSLDNKLIELITSCINTEISQGITFPPDDRELKRTVVDLDKFLIIYNERYKYSLSALFIITSKIHCQVINDNAFEMIDDSTRWGLELDIKEKLMKELSNAISLFLPHFKS